MQDIDVVYLYEHSARELDVACAVKCLAERKYGLKIELQHFRIGINRSFSHYRPRVVILPHYWSVDFLYDLMLEWRKSIFFSLSWEQLFNDVNREIKRPKDVFGLKHVIHHAWGEFFADFLQEAGIPKENIFLNGNPTYMLYEEPYKRYFITRSELSRKYHLDINKKWYFFPENYASAFVTDGYINRLWLERGISLSQAKTMQEFDAKSLKETMKWCSSICNDESIELIIRPRPAISLKEFTDRVSKILSKIPQRMHFIKDETIREWILASDAVFSSRSSSLVDATIASRAAYLIEPIQTPKFIEPDWYPYITRIQTKNEFEKLFKNNIPNTQNEKLLNWARSSMLARGDAIKNLADFIAGLCRGNIKHPGYARRKNVTQSGRFSIPKWLLFEYRKIRWKNLRRNKVMKNIPSQYEKDNVTQDEINTKLDRWKSLLCT